MDLEANKKDGHGVDWSIRYNDISPWYDKIEEYIGIQGIAEGFDDNYFKGRKPAGVYKR